MMGGVLSIADDFPNHHALLVVSSNDFVENFCINSIISQWKESSSEIFICGKKVHSYFPGGYLELKNEKFVEKITEKPGEGNEPSDMINLVFHLFTQPQKLFAELVHISSSLPLITPLIRGVGGLWIPDEGGKTKNTRATDDAYETALQNLFSSGVPTEVVPYSGFWQALKYPWHHLDMTDYFLSTITEKYINPSALIAKTAVINGNVIIEEGVKIFDFAVINGPAYIGKNTIIGNHALIRGSIVGENCGIGHTTEIARSYIRNGVSAHQSYIGDSVIENDVNFGAGTRTGNLRHDEGKILAVVKGEKVNSHKTKLGLFCGSGVKIGINTSFAPGTSVGKNSFLSPGMCITQNIPENSFVQRKFRKEEVEICENREK